MTWLFEGAIDHRDSIGSFATIRPGQVNLMTAGKGIVHSERSPEAERKAGPKLYGMQTWLALPDGREVRVPRQANNLANIAAYYDDGRFSTRLAMNYKGAFIEEYGADADSDSYYGAYTSLDLTVNWQVTPSVTLFGEASNLTNQKLHYYLGNKERPLQVEYYGPRFVVGVKAALF